ncbi:spore protease YyaC [Gorillibacterium sp. sgz5001074]|uniref:spore protease YyaC n=1 Tax=Gorillibacterium sp. sgz5001074 TaxID=3446695 RepID=UPI003F6762A8
MANGTGAYWKKTAGPDKLKELTDRMAADGVTARELSFLCIGTDRSSGDALGPMTGTLLTERGYRRVIGTLEAPCDAATWDLRLAELVRVAAGGPVLAIDACLGHPHSVGLFQLATGPLEAGRSLRRGLPPVGRYSIAAIVHALRDNPVRVLETTPLHRVWTMSRQIVAAVEAAFPPDRSGH